MINNQKRHVVRCRGFSLMEVLVAILILSIGLLGVVVTQYESIKANKSAFDTSIVAALAAEGADRVRANVPGVRHPDTGADRTEYDLITAAGSDPSCIDSGCSYQELAAHDAFEWISSIQNSLPGGQGVICRDSTPYDGTSSAAHQCDGNADANGLDIFAIKIWWDADLDPATPLMAYRLSIVP